MLEDKFLDKISKLLRLAETTNNDEESAAFMQKAQQLATMTAIDLETARQHQANKEKRQVPTQERIVIGTRGKKGLKNYVKLFLQIAHNNDVRCTIAHNSTHVNAFGFKSDIDVVKALYASLIMQMIEASDAFIRSGEYKKEWVTVDQYETYYDSWTGRNRREFVGCKEKPVDGRVARNNFQEAFVSKIGNRLALARLAAIEEAKSAETITENESSGTDLVLKNKSIELADYYKKNNGARGTWNGSSSSSAYSSLSRDAGRNAGERARLGGEKAIGGSRKALNGVG